MTFACQAIDWPSEWEKSKFTHAIQMYANPVVLYLD